MTSSSVKKSEIDKFKEARWWSQDGDMAPLHAMNPVRCKFIRNVALDHFGRARQPLLHPLSGKTVLDVGCGGGILSEALARFGGQITGIDVLPRNIDIARSHAESDPLIFRNVEYKCISAEALVDHEAQFDVVVASEVIEHVKDPANFLSTLAKLVKPTGLLFVTTINRTLQSLFGGIWVAEYVLKLVPRGTHEWSAFLTPDELCLAGSKAGLEIDCLTGMKYNPLTKEWSLSQNTSISYAVSFTKRVHEGE